MEGKYPNTQNVGEEDTYLARPFSNTYCSSTDQSMTKAASGLTPPATKDGNTSPVVLVLGGKE